MIVSGDNTYCSPETLHEETIDKEGMTLVFREMLDESNKTARITCANVEQAEWLITKLESYIMEVVLAKAGAMAIKDNDGRTVGFAITRAAFEATRKA